jgi:hypothetical protein
MAQAQVVSKEIKETVTPTRKERRARGVFNGTKGKFLSIELPGYHVHILNDSPGRLAEALENGYEFINVNEVPNGEQLSALNTDMGEKIRYRVGKSDSGEALFAYHMKIKQEWYEEDQRELQSKVDRTDNAIREGKNGPDTNGFYIPKGTGIKISK